jgi:hypothetical protein
MNIEFDDILPEEISDETAYHLADIFMNLALAIESRYLAQIKRYVDENNPPNQERPEIT